MLSVTGLRQAVPWPCVQGACPAVRLGVQGTGPVACSRQQAVPSRLPGAPCPSGPGPPARWRRRPALPRAGGFAVSGPSPPARSAVPPPEPQCPRPAIAVPGRCRLPESWLLAVGGHRALILSFRPLAQRRGERAEPGPTLIPACRAGLDRNGSLSLQTGTARPTSEDETAARRWMLTICIPGGSTSAMFTTRLRSLRR